MRHKMLKNSDIEKGFQVTGTLVCHFKGRCKVLRSSASGRMLLRAETILTDPREYTLLVDYLQKSELCGSTNCGRLIDYTIEIQEQAPSTIYIVREYYPYISQTLRSMIGKRSASTTKCDSNQIIDMVKDVSQVLSERSRVKLSHGWVCPDTIILDDHGRWGLMLLNANWRPGTKNYNQFVMHQKMRYMSPQLYSKTYDNPNRAVDAIKNDVYCLGVSALEYCVPRKLIEMGREDCDRSAIVVNCLNELEPTFGIRSQQFSIIRQMLAYDEANRIALSDVIREFSRQPFSFGTSLNQANRYKNLEIGKAGKNPFKSYPISGSLLAKENRTMTYAKRHNDKAGRRNDRRDQLVKGKMTDDTNPLAFMLLAKGGNKAEPASMLRSSEPKQRVSQTKNRSRSSSNNPLDHQSFLLNLDNVMQASRTFDIFPPARELRTTIDSGQPLPKRYFRPSYNATNLECWATRTSCTPLLNSNNNCEQASKTLGFNTINTNGPRSLSLQNYRGRYASAKRFESMERVMRKTVEINQFTFC